MIEGRRRACLLSQSVFRFSSAIIKEKRLES